MLWRSIIVWLLIIGCETVMGVLRQLVIVPMLGGGAGDELLARRLGFFVGVPMIFMITWLTVRWMCSAGSLGEGRRGAATTGVSPRTAAGARTFSRRRMILIGGNWAALTFAFEVGIGRLMAMGQTPDGGWSAVWSRLGDDYDVTRGGLMALGLAAMALCPLVAARARIDGQARTARLRARPRMPDR